MTLSERFRTQGRDLRPDEIAAAGHYGAADEELHEAFGLLRSALAALNRAVAILETRLFVQPECHATEGQVIEPPRLSQSEPT